MKTTVDIFSGFLGAGKTMLIKKLLNDNVYGKSTVIIENEFGEVGIDGEILKQSNITVREINSGCICCQVSGSFGDAILEVSRKYNPENIIIEPSGVAKLTEVLSILEGIKFQHKIEVRNIFTLIDIQNFDMYIKNFKEFYENQIRKANKIVLSRTQFVNDEKIESTVSSLKKLNAKAEIIYKPWSMLDGKEFMKNNNIEQKKEISMIKSSAIKTFRKEINHKANDVFESYPIDLINSTSTEELKKKFQFIANSNKFGEIIRAKGVIESIDGGYYQFDYVPNEFKARKIKWSNKNVVSIIGSKLNKKELKQLFR
ncbi:GTP-binding protein [Clostridium saccharobutylicum]|uniref:Putative GTPase, G3E family n=1 Tax=Clostridium saccharobutylicum DSM 13864 TaxID=1345695 RepID=U5MQ67_CLOSA|nr:GTP-binding protein [Clostridium saccharobutylicum]AGX42735.1 putative GTPase, G3E family [Clostridium saccharobutylicum DSM 13864]AQR90031.1 putative GTP-binding protein YjiA [Clostridium saccharobutylicum]AQR99936.1 putative GTP-binding protein YjiA [Clostridium saccharobutylicum]AQS09720.1 putative GTP-binding protein YjiA [Clostridium saccharobutylicum]AQS13920.1 putative GTP-binding protein YjiA [Clostridium saccharobutylicum]